MAMRRRPVRVLRERRFCSYDDTLEQGRLPRRGHILAQPPAGFRLRVVSVSIEARTYLASGLEFYFRRRGATDSSNLITEGEKGVDLGFIYTRTYASPRWPVGQGPRGARGDSLIVRLRGAPSPATYQFVSLVTYTLEP